MDSYPYGQTVIPQLTFKDRDRNLVAVTDIEVEIQPPTSAAYLYTGPFTNPSLGVYTFTIDGDEAGVWKGQASGEIAGDGRAVARFAFCIDPDYVTVGS